MTLFSAWSTFLAGTFVADAVVAIAALIAVRVFHRAPAAFRHAVLLVAVVKFALPPLPGPSLPRLAAISVEGSSIAFDALVVAQLAGTACALAFLGSQMIRVRRIVAAGSACHVADGYLRELARRFGAPVPRLIVSSEAPVPFVTGVVSPVIVLPRFLLDRQPDEVRFAIAHELAHLSLGDPALNRLDALLGAIFWWNPLFRLVRRELLRAREERCDDLVLARTGSPVRDYSLALVEIASAMRSNMSGVAAMTTQSAKSLELRLRNLAARRPRAGALTHRQRLVVAAIALCLLPLTVDGGAEPPKYQHRLHLHAHGH